MPANHGIPPLPRCRPPDAIGPRAHVHRFGLHEMGPTDFLFAAASAVAQGCIIIASVRSGYSVLMWTLAQGAGHCKGTPQIVDLDGELTLRRLSSGYWGCGNRMMHCWSPQYLFVFLTRSSLAARRGSPIRYVYSMFCASGPRAVANRLHKSAVACTNYVNKNLILKKQVVSNDFVYWKYFWIL